MRKLKKKEIKPIPVFKSEDEEREFWDKADTSEYFDWSTAKQVRFPNLKYSTESISLRLPLSLLDDIKIMANKMDVPYQSLIKVILADRVKEDNRKYGVNRKIKNGKVKMKN